MKRILVVIDEQRVKSKLLDFSCFISKLTHSKLIGVFLENKGRPEEVPEEILRDSHRDPGAAEYIRLFRDGCNNRGVSNHVINETMTVNNIINESRFAELLIVDPEMSPIEKQEGILSDFVRTILAKSECPVILAPFYFNGIDEILFAYDGSPASVYAIKQFTYLFPELTTKKITVLQVDENDTGSIVDKQKIGELLQMHYSSIGFQLLKGNASDQLFGYLLGRKNIFVVMGAFGRGMFSGLFKHSTAELVIRIIDLPVFVAHLK